jgi:hypothetical protein
MDRAEARIVRQWQLNPYLLVEAAESAVELVISVKDKAERNRRHTADAPDLEVYAATLTAARAWRAAVFPPDGPGRADLEFPAAMRARAYGDLEEAGLAPDARVITEFLRGWHAQHDEPMGRYAATWVRLLYAG